MKFLGVLFAVIVVVLVPEVLRVKAGEFTKTQDCRIPAIYNFGDSNSDTVGISDAFYPQQLPSGETHFGRPSGRASDGQLIIDLIAESLGLPYLTAYLDSIKPNFEHVANFATGGTTISRVNESWFQNGVSPFPLDIQVTWDEPEAMQNVKRVSPWQVEYVVPTPLLHTKLPPAKKCRISQDPGLLPDGDDELLFPTTGLTHSMIGQLNLSLMNYNSFPASIQGARQDQIYVSDVSNFMRENTHQICSKHFVGNISAVAETVSTKLNIASSQVENLSPDSQSSVYFSGNEQVGRRSVCNFSPKVGISSFLLFGNVIHATKPVEAGFDVGRTEDDDGEVYRERGVDNRLKHSATSPFTEFLDRVDVQCQGDSAGETCLF